MLIPSHAHYMSSSIRDLRYSLKTGPPSAPLLSTVSQRVYPDFILRRRRHSWQGRQEYACNTCNKTLNRASSLIIHVNAHTGATPLSRCDSNMRHRYRNRTAISLPQRLSSSCLLVVVPTSILVSCNPILSFRLCHVHFQKETSLN
ncbi:hypothetical protein EDD85DRAFT_16171 [Armillaria nabsnona]|nr:hypothetical protein EDD85DRAFT_16171 [Armillaria nabsnona]